MSKLILKGQRAKEASYELMNVTTTQKNEALLKMAEKLLENKDYIIKENKKDLDKAIEKGATVIIQEIRGVRLVVTPKKDEAYLSKES